MTDAIAKARARLDELINAGKEVAQKGADSFFDYEKYIAWKMSAMTPIRSVAPNTHYESEFHEANRSYGSSSNIAFSSQSPILTALRDDLDGGHLTNIRGLVRAEVFSELLDQAEHLLNQGYLGPAAVVIGAVLEDHLRKLCAKYPTIALPDNPKLDRMNAELVKAGQYDVLVQKQVLVWAHVRNKAAHAEWNVFNKDDVDQMLRGVLRFVTEQRI